MDVCNKGGGAEEVALTLNHGTLVLFTPSEHVFVSDPRHEQNPGEKRRGAELLPLQHNPPFPPADLSKHRGSVWGKPVRKLGAKLGPKEDQVGGGGGGGGGLGSAGGLEGWWLVFVLTDLKPPWSVPGIPP